MPFMSYGATVPLMKVVLSSQVYPEKDDLLSKYTDLAQISLFLLIIRGMAIKIPQKLNTN